MVIGYGSAGSLAWSTCMITLLAALFLQTVRCLCPCGTHLRDITKSTSVLRVVFRRSFKLTNLFQHGPARSSGSGIFVTTTMSGRLFGSSCRILAGNFPTLLMVRSGLGHLRQLGRFWVVFVQHGILRASRARTLMFWVLQNLVWIYSRNWTTSQIPTTKTRGSV